MNTKQLAAMVENFPSLLSELSEQESAGGQLFSLAKGGGGRTECVCVGERGEWGQKTTYNPPSSLRGENQHIKQEREMMWPCGGGGVCS